MDKVEASFPVAVALQEIDAELLCAENMFLCVARGVYTLLVLCRARNILGGLPGSNELVIERLPPDTPRGTSGIVSHSPSFISWIWLDNSLQNHL